MFQTTMPAAYPGNPTLQYQPGPAIAAPGTGQELAWPFTTPFAAPVSQPISYAPAMPAMPYVPAQPSIPQYPAYPSYPYAQASAYAGAGFGGAFACAAAGAGFGGFGIPYGYNPYAAASAYASPYGAFANASAGFGGFGGYDPYSSMMGGGFGGGLGGGSLLGGILGGAGGLGSLLGGFGNNAFASAFAGNGLASAFAGAGSGLGGGNNLLSLLLSALLNRNNNNGNVVSAPNLGQLQVGQPTVIDPVTGQASTAPQQLITVDVPKGQLQNLTWGDPHFEYYDAQGKLKKYDFQGRPNEWFTLVKDGSLEMNSHFKAWGDKGATVMDKLGFTIKGTKVAYDANGTPTIDGKPLEDGKEYKFASGVPGKNGQGELEARVKWNKADNTLDVITGEYHFVAKKENDYIRLLSSPTEAGVFANGKGADGVLGRAFNPAFANFGKDGKQGANAQGEGFLDKGVDAYKAGGQFQGSTQLAEDTVNVEWGKLAQNANKAGDAK